MTKRLLSVLLVPVALLVGACSDEGGDGLSDEEQAYVDDAMAEFDAEDAEPVTEDDARCMVTSMVEQLGVDRLEEIGLTPGSFATDADLPSNVDEADAETIVNSMSGCIDLEALMLAGIAEGNEVSEEDEECLAEQLDEEYVERVMTALLTDGEEALSQNTELSGEMFRAFSACSGAGG